MSVRRSVLLGLCLVGMLVVAVGSAQATVPRWYLKEVGSFVGFGEERFLGLTEAMPQETLRSQGELTLTSNSATGNVRPVSECLMRNSSLIEDPATQTLPGTLQMESFEVICEKETGGLNAAAPFPCTRVGEPFEMKMGTSVWSSQLEDGKPAKGGRTFLDAFPNMDLEVTCLVTHEHAQYTGELKAQVNIGRLKFLGTGSGELEDPGTGHKFNLKGTEFITPVQQKYIEIRADQH